MAVPKRRKSRLKVRQRKAGKPDRVVTTTACPECGAPTLPHRVCRACGYYRGRQVMSVSHDE
jgi:large subunit ribosomal protein L32